MPTLARIGKLKIQIFADDHNPPHVHLTTPDSEALVSVATGEVLRGNVRRSDLEIGRQWLENNREAVFTEWERLNGAA